MKIKVIILVIISLCISSILIVSADLSQGLKLCYPMDSPKESVSGVYNLTANEGVVVYNNSNCRIGNCSQIFNNKNIIIPANNFTTFNGSNSFNFWIRPKNATVPISDEYVFLTPGGSGRVSISDSFQWLWNSWFQDMVNTQTSKTPPANETYFMITITRDNSNGNVTSYINGIVERSGTTGGVNTTGDQAWILGTNFNNLSDYEGQIDDFQVFNKPLTQAEISNLYNNNLSCPFVSTSPQINITSPSANQTLSSLTFNINIMVTNSSALSYCYFNITRGASTEIANTQIINCMNTTTTVSGDASYRINVFANDSNNDVNISFNDFIVSTGSGGGSGNGGGGGGGGGTNIIQQIINATSSGNVVVPSICLPFRGAFEKAYTDSKSETSFLKRYTSFLQSFWDYTICKSAASIVPI